MRIIICINYLLFYVLIRVHVLNHIKQKKRIHPESLLILVNDRNKIPATWNINLVQLPNWKQISSYNTKCAFYQPKGYYSKIFQKKTSQWISQSGTNEHQLELSVVLVFL